MEDSVLIRVQNVNLFMEGVLSKEVRTEIQETLSYTVPNFRFTKKYKADQQKARLGILDNREPWDGRVTIAKRYYQSNGILKAPSGLLSFVREILAKHNIPYEVIDERPPLIKTAKYTTEGLLLRDYQEEVVKKAITRGRGILKASTGCHAKGQGIMMFDGSQKNVEDVEIGDRLMGPDSLPRTVLSLCRGYGKIYVIKPSSGKDFTANDNHVLTMVKDDGNLMHIIDISVRKWLRWKKRHEYRLVRIAPTPNSDHEDPLTPYRLGFRIEMSAKFKGYDNYYGFTLDSDGRYLLDDFTVTHNSGKTEMVVDMTVRASAFPAIYYVTSCDLLEQAHERYGKYVRENGKETRIGVIGDGNFDPQPITIATIQSVWRALFPNKKIATNEADDYHPDDKTKFNIQQQEQIRKLAASAQFVYIDEAHHVSAATIQDILGVSHGARIRIGGSASPWRDDGLDILIEACFGKRICDISASLLIQMGYLVKPHICFNHFNQQLGFSTDFASIYNNYVTENDERNQWIAERARMHIGMNRPTIILVKVVKHAKILKELLPEAEVLASSGSVRKTPKKRKEVLDRMRSRDVMCIIGTTLLDEGVDVPCATTGIFAGGGKSSTRELQRVGRLMRKDPLDPTKNLCYIEEFHDHVKWLTTHSKKRREILQTEKEFEITDSRVI